MKILVSAIISTYNSELFLEGRLENLFHQTINQNLELIIVNSGSRQNESAIVNKYLGRNIPVKYIHTDERETIYRAWNRAIKMSSGKFITNANTDDRLRNDALEILSNYLIDNPKIGMVYADQSISTIPNQNFDDSKKGKTCRFPDFDRIYNFERCIIGSQPMWRSDIHFKDGIWFDESLEVSGDHEFQLRISQKYEIKHIKKVLGSFYKSPEKSNKEYENPQRNFEEVNYITDKYIDNYLSSLNITQLQKLLNKYKPRIKIPIKLFLALRMLDKKLFKGIYPKFIFHSVEFTYYFSALLYERIGLPGLADKTCKKYLKYNDSRRLTILHSRIKN